MLPFRSGATRFFPVFVACLSLFLSGSLLAGKGKQNKPKKEKKAATATPEPTAKGLTDIPLPIGHEAKGLTLPDFDPEGRLRGKFTAGNARRIDELHVLFHDLHIATFDAQSKPDLDITTTDGTFNLQTRILSSNTRGTIKRADFQIDGDSMEFNTEARQGTLRGNVKMVITGKVNLAGQPKP